MAARLTAYLVCIIVGATLIAGLIVGAQNDSGGPVDLIIYNGMVHTGAGEPPAEAVAIRGNRIVRVGSNWQVRRLRDRHTALIDARHHTVLPAFNEAHARVVAGSRSLGGHAQESVEPDARALETLEPMRDERMDALRTTFAHAHRLGITSLQDSEASAEDLERYERLRDQGELDVRIYAILPIQAGLTGEDAARLDAVRQRYADDPFLKAGAVRVTVSDLVDARASLRRSSAAEAETPAVLTQAELDRIVGLMDERGWQVIVHATSDGAAAMALEAFAHAAEGEVAGDRRRRHRIELHHLVDDVELIPSQSLSIVTDSASSRAPFFGLFDGGHRIVLGNRWPAAALDPLSVVLAAGGDTPDTGLPHTGALAAAIDAYTGAPAYASFDDQRKGIIAPDLLADLIVLSTDIFSLPSDRRRDAFVETTIFDGRVVFTRSHDDEETE